MKVVPRVYYALYEFVKGVFLPGYIRDTFAKVQQ